jgi:Cu(I)/Ag(I) efflux system membrane fusion protein
VALVLALLAGVFVGLSLWRRTATEAPQAVTGVWTCSMHPQIRLDHPGKCPLCGMDLVPLATSASTVTDPRHLSLSEHARRMATLETVVIEPRALVKEIRTVGRVAFDETRLAQIAARVSGRIDEVFANFTGTMVKRGDHLVKIYSPELLTTQEELLIAARGDAASGRAGISRSLTASARRRLELWGITAEQINELTRTGVSQTHLVVYAPIGGTVLEKNVREGQYVKEGDELYSIADLTHVWLILQLYESDVPWVRFGQPVEVSLEGRPERLQGFVGFVEPVLDDATRSVGVRVVLRNEQGLLKPAMYAHATLRIPILPNGVAGPTGLEGKFACPMHPYVVADVGGACQVCGMPLERVPGDPPLEAGPPVALAVPASAVLSTGSRRLVYVERSPGAYESVEPRLGPRAGDYFLVLEGLTAGQRVVTSGGFLLDSQFQLAGKPSLLYPLGLIGADPHAGHAPGAPQGGKSMPGAVSSPKAPAEHRH